MAPMTATDRVATMMAVAGRDLNDELTVIVTCLAEVLAQPYVFEDEQDRKDVARLVGRWHTFLQLTAANHGWAYERLSDLARVLRIASSRNALKKKTSKDRRAPTCSITCGRRISSPPSKASACRSSGGP